MYLKNIMYKLYSERNSLSSILKGLVEKIRIFYELPMKKFYHVVSLLLKDECLIVF